MDFARDCAGRPSQLGRSNPGGCCVPFRPELAFGRLLLLEGEDFMSFNKTLCVLFFSAIPCVSQAQDFIKTLADRLQTKPEYLIFNLPPRPDAWPGAIFTNDFRLPIVRGRKDDPALARGEPIEIDVTDLI